MGCKFLPKSTLHENKKTLAFSVISLSKSYRELCFVLYLFGFRFFSGVSYKVKVAIYICTVMNWFLDSVVTQNIIAKVIYYF